MLKVWASEFIKGIGVVADYECSAKIQLYAQVSIIIQKVCMKHKTEVELLNSHVHTLSTTLCLCGQQELCLLVIPRVH